MSGQPDRKYSYKVVDAREWNGVGDQPLQDVINTETATNQWRLVCCMFNLLIFERED